MVLLMELLPALVHEWRSTVPALRPVASGYHDPHFRDGQRSAVLVPDASLAFPYALPAVHILDSFLGIDVQREHPPGRRLANMLRFVAAPAVRAFAGVPVIVGAHTSLPRSPSARVPADTEPFKIIQPVRLLEPIDHLGRICETILFREPLQRAGTQQI